MSTRVCPRPMWGLPHGHHRPPGRACRVFREIAPGDFRGVGTVPAELKAGGVAIVDLALPVRTGDRLGLSFTGGNLINCEMPGAPTDRYSKFYGLPTDGAAFKFTSNSGKRLNVAATFEPDPAPLAPPETPPTSAPLPTPDVTTTPPTSDIPAGAAATSDAPPVLASGARAATPEPVWPSERP